MSGINVSEVREWAIELRYNDLSMGEENVKVKKKKLDYDEQTLIEQVAEQILYVPENRFCFSGEQLAEEKKEQEEREKKLAEQQKEVAETRDNLRRLEFEFREKNAILEILLKVRF